jgi:hypothetical protein
VVCGKVNHSGTDGVREVSVDIAAWLRDLGLEQHEAACRANEIDANVLPRLTAEDLKDLGVTLVGHRRRLLDALPHSAQSQRLVPSLRRRDRGGFRRVSPAIRAMEVLVYFGYPQAHEDDAERDTDAAWRWSIRVQRLNLSEQLNARFGIATGLVVSSARLSSTTSSARRRT